MRSEYIHISSFWGLGIFLKENICGTKIWPPKKNQAYFPGVGNTGTSWSLVGSTISFQTWHQLGWRSDSFPQPSDWFIRSTCLYKGQGFCFSILAKGYISSNQVFFLETHKNLQVSWEKVHPTKWILLGSWYTIQTSHHPSNGGSQASRQRFEKGRRQVATSKYPKPQTRNLSYNHWFYTALRSCFWGGTLHKHRKACLIPFCSLHVVP